MRRVSHSQGQHSVGPLRSVLGHGSVARGVGNAVLKVRREASQLDARGWDVRELRPGGAFDKDQRRDVFGLRPSAADDADQALRGMLGEGSVA